MAIAATEPELVYMRSDGQVSQLGLSVYAPGAELTAPVGTVMLDLVIQFKQMLRVL